MQIGDVVVSPVQRQPWPDVASSGMISAVGFTAASTSAAVRAGVSGFAETPWMTDPRGDKPIVAAVPWPQRAPNLVSGMVDMAVAAMLEALQGLPGRHLADPMPVVVAIPEQRPGLGTDLAAALAGRLRAAAGRHIGIASFELLAGGHSAGLAAVRHCMKAMAATGSRYGLVGAVDSYLASETIDWLESAGRLHSAANPWGFIPGEASAFLVLKRGDAVRASGLLDQSLLRIAAAAHSAEAGANTRERPLHGRALAAAIDGCLQALPAGEQVTDIICDMNGERSRAKDYAFALPRFAVRCRDAVDFRNPADCLGDVGTASGLVQLALGCEAVARGHACGRHLLVLASSDDGDREALLATAPVAL